MLTKTSLQRVAFSPGEFAALFGKSQTWGYRQIYAGKVKAITEHGRILIPAAEVEAILAKAGVYDGLKAKPVQTKADIQRLASRVPDAWGKFVEARREQKVPAGSAKAATLKLGRSNNGSRKAALDRLTGKG